MPSIYPLMDIEPGSYRFGPENATLAVRTGRTGAAAKAGHDLVIHVTSWEATLRVGADPAQSSVTLNADPSSLRVHQGSGGMQALGADDRANIHKTIDGDVLRGKAIGYRSSEVRAGAGHLHVSGDLQLLDHSGPLSFQLSAGDDGQLGASATVRQSEWGIKPYSTLFGALKVADEVEVILTASLPRS